MKSWKCVWCKEKQTKPCKFIGTCDKCFKILRDSIKGHRFAKRLNEELERRRKLRKCGYK